MAKDSEVWLHVAYSGEWLVILSFVGLFIALYGSGAFLLWRRFFGAEEQRVPIGLTGKFVLLACLIGFGGAAYSYFIEPYRLEVTHVKLPIDGLPASSSPIIIAQVSDLHCDAETRLERKISPAVKKEHPDLIFFTGDACNSEDGFANFYGVIKDLEDIAPTICVKGDWDYNFDAWGRAGLNKPAPLKNVYTVRGAKICILGIPAGSGALAAVRSAPKNVPLIMLTHGPDSDATLTGETDGIDLICCGHTHGGQIAVPGYGALITQSKTKRQYAAGLHSIGKTFIYTNRGIGMEGHFPRVRFGAVPEITIYELVSSGKPKVSPPDPPF
jgi:hypothetical protein